MQPHTDPRVPEELSKCFLPIFRTSGPGLPEHEGTGILVKTPSAHWLLTAAHVMVLQAKSEVYLPGHPSLFPLSGEIYSTSELTAQATDRDELDIAFTKLKDDEIQSLQRAGMRFHSTATNVVSTQAKDFGRTWCYVAGYPADSVKVDEDNKVAAGRPFLFQGSVYNSDEMLRRRLGPKRRIGIRYSQVMDLDGNPMKRPNPKGMSGGPIWIFDGGSLVLAGMAIEFHQSKSTIVGVRILDLFQAMEKIGNGTGSKG